MKKYTDTKQKSYASRKRRVQVRLRAMKMRVKKGDKVKVISGKDKGKTGEVTRVLPKTNRVVVEGVALAKRSLRSTGKGQSGRIVERTMSIHASNVALVEKKKSATKTA
ncbi:50S ribosomal protein L24 [Candidatus Parcubacteria bacterium]|nr:50S ribosomal protein L24 [Candidatus Parcubacteria bacterium]